MLKAAFYTLGCKVNYYETESLKGIFLQEGFDIVDFGVEADLFVINTCTVTHVADRKSRQTIRRAKKLNPEALVAVIGCYPQVNPEAIRALPQVDLFLGTQERLSLPGLVKRRFQGQDKYGGISSYDHEGAAFEEMPWLKEQGRARAFLKIQDGCDRFCSYCVVPLARGPLRSLPLEKGLDYLREIGRAGFKEVVLTGIHLGLYGMDSQDRESSLATFLEEAVKIEGIQRIRLSSIEPADFDEKLLEVISRGGKLCPHLHIPLQSGDNFILSRMKRSYNTSFYASLLRDLRGSIADLAISSDIMVGFPGEEEKHFLNSLQFVRECAFSSLHVFKYSPRPGTEAATYSSPVKPEVQEKRSREMIALGEELAQQFQEQHLGRTFPVLFENKIEYSDLSCSSFPRECLLKEEKITGNPLIWEGFTPNYLRVRALGKPDWRGKVKHICLKKRYPNYLEGSEPG